MALENNNATEQVNAPAPAPQPEPIPAPTDTTQPEAPSLLKNIAAARSNGASWDEINGALGEQRAQAKAKGISDKEFNDALGLPNPPEGQQYFTFGDIAQHSAKAFIDYPSAAFDALKTDWQRMMAPMHEPMPDNIWDYTKQQYDSLIGAGKVPIDVFNLAVQSTIGAVYGAAVARPLSMGEANLQAMIKNKLQDTITNPEELKLWQQKAEEDANLALLALGPEGAEISTAARAKVSPMIQSKDTLDAAASVVGDPAKMAANLDTVANNLHDNWVKTGEQPLEAAQRAQHEPDFRDELHVPAEEPTKMSLLPEAKEPVLDPKPVEEGQKINPEFANDKPSSPSIVEPPSLSLGAKVAGADALEPLSGISDFKDLFIEDPIRAGKVAAEYIKDTFVPTLASPEAADAALILREAKGQATRATAITQAALNSTWRKAGSIVGEAQDAFIDYMQGRSNGAKIDPALQETADTLRSLFEDVAAKMHELPNFAKMEFQKDYFPQNWENTSATRARWDAMVSRQGSTGFTKAKIIPSHAEGRALGFIPKYNHPLETAMNNLRNAYRVIAHSEALDDFVERGLAMRMKGNGEEIPAGWTRLEGGLAGDLGEGSVWASPDVARIYNNSISRGFTGVPGEIFKTLNAASNVLRQMKLGLFNVYHGFTTIISSMARESGLGVGELLNVGTRIKEGDVLGAAKNAAGGVARIVSSPVAPLKHFMEGAKGLKEYKVPGSTDPQTQQLVDLLTKTNSMTIKMPDYMREGAYHDMFDAWKRGDYDNLPQKAADFVSSLTIKNVAVKIPVAVAKQFSSFMTTTMKPIFDGLVPRVKTGASMEAMQQWMEDHPTATFDQQKVAAAQIGDSMDNLFGEMVRDNLFWNKQFEQAVNLGFLSYGWVMGELRGVTSAVKDLATLHNTSNAQNLIGFVMTMAVANSVYEYAKTGTAPQTVTDLAFPRTGGKQRAGGEWVPERAVLPGHTSQLAHYGHDFVGELFGNEANPLIGMIGLLTTQKNWASYDAYNRNGDFAEKADQFGTALWQEIVPLTVENFEHPAKKNSNLGDFERGIGVRQSPQFIANPEGVEKQTHARQERAWGDAKRFQDRTNKSYEGSE